MIITLYLILVPDVISWIFHERLVVSVPNDKIEFSRVMTDLAGKVDDRAIFDVTFKASVDGHGRLCNRSFV